MTAVIHTHDLTRRFGDNTAVDRLTLDVQRGEVFAFLGHNGAGKTTTVRLLNGVLTATAGAVQVFGLSPATQGEQIRARTGVLTETPSLDERLTAQDILRFFAEMYGVPGAEIGKRSSRLLEMFELADRAKEKVGGYSKGMKQRLALARLLLHEPELIFLDEPTASLDPIAIRQVHDLIFRVSQQEGRTVFIATHNLHEAQKLATRVGVMNRGQLVAVGTPGDLAKQIGMPVRYELALGDGQGAAALGTLRGFRGVRAVTAEGDVLTVSGADDEVIPDLLAALVGAGLRVYRAVPLEASLEDIYFTLYGEQANHSAAAAHAGAPQQQERVS